MSLRRRIIIGLVVIGAVLYAFNLNNVLFWDDADWITQNPCIHEPLSHLGCLLGRDVLYGIGQESNYYRPFLMLTFAFNWALGGASPWGYHLISNGLHIANAILIFLLLSRVLAPSQVVRPGRTEVVSGVAALAWLIHPLQTEAVAYISGRGDPLSVFLMLSAMLLLLRARECAPESPFFSYHFALSILCAILALFSRETAVLFPLYLSVTLLAFTPSEPKKALTGAWPFYVISALYGLLRLTVLDFSNTLNWYAQSNVYTEHVTYRICTFLQVLWVYVRLIVAPVGLHMERNVPVLTVPWQYPAFLGVAIVVAALWWVVVAWRRGNRVPFFGVLMFLIPLGPSSGILAPINALLYEHWLYLSLFGFATLAAVYGVRLYEYLRSHSRTLSYLFLTCVICHLSFISIQTIRRNIIWGMPEQLYKQILQYEPQNVRVLNNLANLYADKDNSDDAERYWLLAIQSDPAQPAPYHNLGNLYRDRGDIATAQQWYERSVQASPTFWYAYQNLAAMLLDAGQTGRATEVLLAWQKGNPEHPLTYYVLARILATDGKRAEARAMLEAGLPAAVAAGPDYIAAYQELAAQL